MVIDERCTCPDSNSEIGCFTDHGSHYVNVSGACEENDTRIPFYSTCISRFSSAHVGYSSLCIGKFFECQLHM